MKKLVSVFIVLFLALLMLLTTACAAPISASKDSYFSNSKSHPIITVIDTDLSESIVSKIKIDWSDKQDVCMNLSWLDDDNILINYVFANDEYSDILYLSRYNISTDKLYEIINQEEPDFITGTKVVKSEGNSFAFCGRKGILFFENDKLVKKTMNEESGTCIISPNYKYELFMPEVKSESSLESFTIQDVTTSEEIDLIPNATTATFSDNSKYCVFTCYDDKNQFQILIYNLETKEKRTFPMDTNLRKITWSSNGNLYLESGQGLEESEGPLFTIDEMNIQTGETKNIVEISDPKIDINYITYNTSEYIASIYSENGLSIVALFSTDNQEVQKTLMTYQSTVSGLKYGFSPTNNYFYMTSIQDNNMVIEIIKN